MNRVVSIIVPIYGVEKYLNQCMEALVNQTYKNIEILLVDDGSKDNCGIMCDMWAEKDTRITVIHQENMGLAGARNTGLANAHGDFIAFVDSDDYIEADYVELLLRACVDNEAQIAIGNYNIVDSESLRIIASGKQEGMIHVWSSQETLMHREYDRGYFIGTIVWNKLFAIEIIKNMCFPVGKLYEDTVYTYDAITRAKKIVYIDKPLYNYRANRVDSIMSAVNYEKISEDLFPLLNERSAMLRNRGYNQIADKSDYNACESIVTYIETAQSLKNLEYIPTLNKWMNIFYSRCKGSVGIWNRVKMYHICPYMVFGYDYIVERIRRIYHKFRG